MLVWIFQHVEYWYIGILVYWYIGILVYWCIGVLVYWYIFFKKKSQFFTINIKYWD